jgi:hypothetical protein
MKYYEQHKDAIIEALNKVYPMRGIFNSNEWFRVGMFELDDKPYSFMVRNHMGTFRGMGHRNYANEWFEVTYKANEEGYNVVADIKLYCNPER